MSVGKIQFRNQEDLRSLFGPRDRNLRRLRDALQVDVVVRGEELQVIGDDPHVDRATQVMTDLRAVVERQGFLADEEVERVLIRETPSSDDMAVEVFHKQRKVRPLGEGQGRYIRAILENDLVLCSGPAGSGKTYLATALAVNALRKDLVRKIVLVRPAVEAGEKLGFLPGDLLEKVNPFLRPLLDALGDIIDYDQVQRYIERDVIEIVPLAFMRGRTLNNTFIILDEGQNTTVTQMKMFLTRMGQNSKVVVTGDITQVDLEASVTCGMADAIGRLAGIPGIAIVELEAADIVRHTLVRKIVAAYEPDKTQDKPAASAVPSATGLANTAAYVPKATTSAAKLPTRKTNDEPARQDESSASFAAGLFADEE